jgi:Uma2 family endonuclease
MDCDYKFTSADLDLMPDNGKRYEIIDGELYISDPRDHRHQYVCGRLCGALIGWDMQDGFGIAVMAPGLIFSEYDDVAPDVVWMSRERLRFALDESGHLRIAPELIAEVLQPGKHNGNRDRIIKLALYSRRAVQEYWIVDWVAQRVEVYRRELGRLKQTVTLLLGDSIESPLLPGFSCQVRSLFILLP